MTLDRTIPCRACGRLFVHTADEQEIADVRDRPNDPTRCPACRREDRSSGPGAIAENTEPRQL